MCIAQLSSIANLSTDGQTVHSSPALVQPVASDDVAIALTGIAVGAPLNGTVEVAGPEKFRLDELIQRMLSANQGARKVITDIHAHYSGVELKIHSLPLETSHASGQ